MVETEPTKQPQPASRFDDADLWGDAAEDPLDALNSMTDNDILAATREFES